MTKTKYYIATDTLDSSSLCFAVSDGEILAMMETHRDEKEFFARVEEMTKYYNCEIFEERLITPKAYKYGTGKNYKPWKNIDFSDLKIPSEYFDWKLFEEMLNFKSPVKNESIK